MFDDIPSGTALRDEIDQLMLSFPRTSREVQDRIKGVEQSLKELNQAVAPCAELAEKLKAYDERMTRTVNELRQRNQTLQTKNDAQSRDLAQLQEENARLNELLSSLRTESRNLQSQINASQTERESLTRNLSDAVQQLDELRGRERELSGELALYQNDHRRAQARVAELEAQILAERQENQLSKEQYEREVTKRMQDQKAELDRRHAKQLEEEREDYERKFRKAKASFKDALNEASGQVKSLENERNLWHAQYNQLAKNLEESQRKMKVKCQELLEERFRLFVKDWNRQDLGHYAPGQVAPLPRAGNLLEDFFRDATDQSPSEASVNGNGNGNGNGNDAGRKRAFSNRDEARHYIAGRVASNQPTATNQPQQQPPPTQQPQQQPPPQQQQPPRRNNNQQPPPQER